MKNILFALALLSSLGLYSQKAEIKPTVIELDSTFTKDEIYSSLKLFLVEYFVDANEVIQVDDKEQGVIVFKGTKRNYMKGIFGEKNPAGFWHFTGKFEIKDGRYRYSVYDIYVKQTYATTSAENVTGYNVKRLAELINELDTAFGNIEFKKTNTDW